jgi:hypothetical protein
MVFQMFALGPHSLQKLSSAEFPEDAPVSRFQMPPSPEVDDVTEDDVDDAGDANPCNVFGTVVTSCDSDWLPMPAGVAVAWPTAADWPASAPALVFCVGPVNDVSWVAAADEPA